MAFPDGGPVVKDAGVAAGFSVLLLALAVPVFLPEAAPGFLAGLAIAQVYRLLLSRGLAWTLRGKRETWTGRFVLAAILRLVATGGLLWLAFVELRFLPPLAVVLGIFWSYLAWLLREAFAALRAGGNRK